ncbi:MAG: hypothetical protein ACK55I_04280, partial [bacterium]
EVTCSLPARCLEKAVRGLSRAGGAITHAGCPSSTWGGRKNSATSRRVATPQVRPGQVFVRGDA